MDATEQAQFDTLNQKVDAIIALAEQTLAALVSAKATVDSSSNTVADTNAALSAVSAKLDAEITKLQDGLNSAK